jgi:hypothetical protein
MLFEHRVAASLIYAEELQVLHTLRIRLTKGLCAIVCALLTGQST